MKCPVRKRASLSLLFVAVVLAHAPPSRAQSQPDILLLMPDQMRGDCLSALDHPVVRTPNLDRLAQAGALFRRAYSTVPSCIPARFALLTGRSPQSSGVVGFQSRPITSPTLPGLLSRAGYATVLVGRNMHQEPANPSVGFDREVRGSTYVSDDAYDAYLKRAAPDGRGIRQVVTDLGLDFNLWPAQPWPLPVEQHPTAWVIRQSQQVLAETSPAKPLFLVTSFYAPHPPLFPPPTYFDDIRRRLRYSPARGDWVDWPSLSNRGDRTGHRVLLEGEVLERAEAGYFGLIEHLDNAIAPLVAAFKERSAQSGRPWVIVVTSDHGELLGDHGYFRKCEPYEGSASIPFIITADPKLAFKPGLRCFQPVGLEDLLPTLVTLAGTNPPPGTDGVNLVPTLRGGDAPIRDVLHFEHSPCYDKAQAFHALTDGHLKYIWRPEDGREQLFDLDRDPREEHDLARVPTESPRVAAWRDRLIRRLLDRPEGFTDGKRLLTGRPYPAVMREPPPRQ